MSAPYPIRELAAKQRLAEARHTIDWRMVESMNRHGVDPVAEAKQRGIAGLARHLIDNLAAECPGSVKVDDHPLGVEVRIRIHAFTTAQLTELLMDAYRIGHEDARQLNFIPVTA